MSSLLPLRWPALGGVVWEEDEDDAWDWMSAEVPRKGERLKRNDMIAANLAQTVDYERVCAF